MEMTDLFHVDAEGLTLVTFADHGDNDLFSLGHCGDVADHGDNDLFSLGHCGDVADHGDDGLFHVGTLVTLLTMEMMICFMWMPRG